MTLDLIKLNIKFDPQAAASGLFSDDFIEEIKSEIAEEYSDLALKALQSKVPVRTFQLRDGQIKVEISDDSSYATIYATDDTHTNSFGKSKPTAAQVADALDKGPYHRRRNAVAAFSKFSAPGVGEPTANWIGEAFDGFLEVI